jgi:dTDP-4-amino-4,6-dideoxygalactose transaminase
MTNNNDLAQKMRMIANHGQEKKYYHKVLGCNSRLDTIQAAVLNVKLRYLDVYNRARNAMALFYDKAFFDIDELQVPKRQSNSTHVFHQYTLKVKNGRRNELQKYLSDKGIPSMIYYPLPLYRQEAFQQFTSMNFKLDVTEDLCNDVLSLPIHSEMNTEHINFVCDSVKTFFYK